MYQTNKVLRYIKKMKNTGLTKIISLFPDVVYNRINTKVSRDLV